MPRPMSWCDGTPVTFWPRYVTLPVLGFIMPLMVRRVVVLPAPLPPISATISPSFTVMFRPLSASIWP